MVDSKKCTAVTIFTRAKFGSPDLENATYQCTLGLDQALSFCSLNLFTSYDIESKSHGNYHSFLHTAHHQHDQFPRGYSDQFSQDRQTRPDQTQGCELCGS